MKEGKTGGTAGIAKPSPWDKAALVSVIIPVYNVKEYLPECVESVRKQTLSNLEIILVDDGSTDGSAELCDEYARQDKRIRALHQKNGGSTRARNAGLLASTGAYVGFVDSDDWIEPQMYEALLTSCLENRADIAVSLKYCNHEKSQYKEECALPAGLYEKGEESGKALVRNLIYAEDYGKRGVSPNLYDKLFRRGLLQKWQLSVDERIRYGEDDVCVYACLLDAERVIFLDQAFYHYRARAGSLCHSSDASYFEQITWFYRQLRERFTAHPLADVLMEQLNRYMLEFVLRGVNKQFGFGYGVVTPFYLPPYGEIAKRSLRRIALYGAGNVGQDYFRAFALWGNVAVAVWVDRQWEDCREQGLPVQPVADLLQAEYDAVLIAVEKRGLAEQIRADLVGYGVAGEKILFAEPKKLIQDIGGCAK